MGLKALGVLLAWVASAWAQSWYPRHNITFGAGGASPRADLRPYFMTRPAVAISYGYRFARNFQLETGLDTVFGAAGIREYYESPLGLLRIRDFQFLVPVGGRAIVPVAGERFHFFGGGGVAWLRYSERIRQPLEYLRIECPVCNSRSGWAKYALSGLNVFMDRGRHFRTGVNVKVYRGHTEGDPFGAAPGVRTRDRWLQIFGELGLSF